MSDFHNSTRAKDGKQSKCKSCNTAAATRWQIKNVDKVNKYRQSRSARHSNLRKARVYGISVEEVEALLVSTQGKCSICKKKPKQLVIDHDHATGRVRGVLCSTCNRALGMFYDNPTLLRSAIRYLQK